MALPRKCLFYFHIAGQTDRGQQKETYNCSSGSLLFHSWQEPHYNIKPEGFIRGFHIELDKDFFKDFSFDVATLEGSFKIDNADIKFLFYRIFRETKISDDITEASIQASLLEIFGRMLNSKRKTRSEKPLWMKKLEKILRDGHTENLSLKSLSDQLNIHPAHLSRDFSKHFYCTLGEYVRKLRASYFSPRFSI